MTNTIAYSWLAYNIHYNERHKIVLITLKRADEAYYQLPDILITMQISEIDQ